MQKKIAEAKKGLYTEDDLQKKVTSEVDRRVESGIRKGVETEKEKWEREFTEKANLTAEELAKKQLDEQLTTLTTREREIKKKANLIDAKDMLSTAEIPKAQYEKIITMLVSDDETATKTNVQSFIDMYSTTKVEIETKVKTELSKIPPPNVGGQDNVVTKESFGKMGYAEKLAFKKF